MRVSVTVSTRLVFSKRVILSFEKVLKRICPIKLTFSGFVVQSKFCGISIKLFHTVHFVEDIHYISCIRFDITISCVLNFQKKFCIKQQAICFIVKNVKIVSLDQFL